MDDVIKNQLLQWIMGNQYILTSFCRDVLVDPSNKYPGCSTETFHFYENFMTMIYSSKFSFLHLRKVLETEKVLSDCSLPESCLKNVSGSIVFEDQNPNIVPISNFHCEDVINCSQNIILSHYRQAKHARVLIQVWTLLFKVL